MEKTQGVVVCEYCDFHIQLGATGPASGERGSQTAAVPLIAVGALVALGIGAGFFFSLPQSGTESIPESAPPLLTDVEPAQTVESTAPETVEEEPVVQEEPAPELGWDDVGGPPQVVTIEGQEHVLGRVRMRPDDQLRVTVFHSVDLKERWSTPDLGTYGDAYRAVHYQAGSGKLAVTDGKNHLRIFNLTTGKEEMSLPLSDRAQQICPLKNGQAIWIQLLDKRHVRFDLSSMKSSEAKRRPSQCPKSKIQNRKRQPEGVKRSLYPRLENFKAKRLFVDGEDAVVFGAKSPGTAIPVAAGFKKGTRKARWQKSVLQIPATSYRSPFFGFKAGLAGGRFATYYGVGSDDEWRAVALDARSGDLLWETKLKPIFAVDLISGIAVTPQYVYLVRTNSLDVLDAKSGKYVGSLGDENYD
jgi:outer membrane protein assembly factor BamB